MEYMIDIWLTDFICVKSHGVTGMKQSARCMHGDLSRSNW